ncbi:hypothetical protein Mal48_28910 [Thalassoglobus polymorphus]|uniref:Uncharacterized protein n=2 Tax=Thalassoglobus polymorphus TaxID=2527994 RepID=A0A517QPV8_9PLAN|nr:hypothetical protein Mal48_28910 [Thalassoglobus polymorphus]
MKLLGQDLELKFLQPFSLKRPDGRDWTFQLSPLPLGFQKKLRDKGITPPTPPVKISRDSTGKPIRDHAGQVVTFTDLNSAEFLSDSELYHQRVAVLAVVEALRNDSSVCFETVPPEVDGTNGLSWGDFADAVFQELEQAGFTPGDLLAFCDEICRISNMLDGHLREAQANFSSLPVNSSS